MLKHRLGRWTKYGASLLVALMLGQSVHAAEAITQGFMNDEEGSLPVHLIGRYDSGEQDGDGGITEIVAWCGSQKTAFVVNGKTGMLDVIPMSALADAKEGTVVDLPASAQWDVKSDVTSAKADFAYGDMTSVAVVRGKGIVAVAVQAEAHDQPGYIVLYNLKGELQSIIEAGVQPDAIMASPDGRFVLSANEGEPREGYGDGLIDPPGSVTIVDLTQDNKAVTLGFEAFDAQRDQLASEGVVLQKETMPSTDLEPKYITVSEDSTMAFVALQEANAIARIDLGDAPSYAWVKSLGFKDFSKEGMGIDLYKDKEIKIEPQDLLGIRMPDGIYSYTVDGASYILTANEGDGREWGEFLNEKDILVDEANEDTEIRTLDTSLYDGVDADKTYLFGGRSFSIYKADDLSLVYDSGDTMEQVTAKYLPEVFNTTNDEVKFDNRSNKKGPEPEYVMVGEVDGKPYAFVGLERIGGVAIYDIQDPTKAKLVNYINTRQFDDDIAGDVAPEGLAFVPEKQSPNGQALVLAANEVSGTVTVYAMGSVATDGAEVPKTGENRSVLPMVGLLLVLGAVMLIAWRRREQA